MRPRQLKIDEVSEQCQLYPSDGHRMKIVNDLLVNLVVQDLQSLPIVENRGFKAFVRGVDKRV